MPATALFKREIKFIVQMNTRDIGYFHNIIEAHEGIGIVTTSDASSGIVTILITPDFEERLTQIISETESTGRNIRIIERKVI